MEPAVVGRDAELAVIDRFLDAIAGMSHVLVVEGEAGIGKTTLLDETARRASAGSLNVLSCRPVEAESKLSFTSLAELLEPVADDVLPELPAPQRLALEVALLRAPPRHGQPDPRVIGTAVCSTLAHVTRSTPLVLAVDDVQWLDSPSARALAFAVRRLRESPFGIVISLRPEPNASEDPLELTHAFRDRIDSIRLGPLSLGALFHMLRTHLDHAFPRPTLQRIQDASGGNPLFALELGRALTGAGVEAHPGEPLPVPDTLSELVSERVRRLPPASRRALLAAAALSKPSRDLVVRVLRERAGSALRRAEQDDIIDIRAGRVRFTHPLLAASIYASATQVEKQRLHRRLAAVVAEPEEQARHLALGAGGPDDEVASTLEAAAARADERGAPEAAAELALLATRLTPSNRAEALAHRRAQLGAYLLRAGDTQAAQSVLEELIEEQPPGTLRARALELVARVLNVTGSSKAATERCRQALAEAGDDVELRARINATLALVCFHDFPLRARHARAAIDLLDLLDDPDPAVLSQALMAYAGAEAYLGHGVPTDVVDRALELEQLSPAPNVADRMSAALGPSLKYAGDFDRARYWLEKTYRAALEEGDEGSLPYALSHLPQLELWTGNWSEAEARAREHLELAERTGQSDQRRQALYSLALVHAHMGKLDEAAATAEDVRAEALAAGDPWGEGTALLVLGFVELSRGRAEKAVRHFARNEQIREQLGLREPPRPYADYAEALLETGKLDEAERITAMLDEGARTFDWAAARANAARCRGLLAAARNDLDAASAALDEALAQHERVTVSFDLARTLIALGMVRRGRGERRTARDALERARSIFAELGAPLWAERAEAELRRIPGRRSSRKDALTPTEEKVAALAATGQTNKEVASALFMSPKTVEANLSRVYRKLGIHSRAELGARMSRRADLQPASKP